MSQLTATGIEHGVVSIPYVITREEDSTSTLEDLVFIELDEPMKILSIRKFAAGERTFRLKVTSAEKTKNGIVVSARSEADGDTITLTFGRSSLTYLRTTSKTATLSLKAARRISRAEAIALMSGDQNTL